MGFSVCSSCYNKTPFTGELVDNSNLFLTVPEAGKSKVKALADSGPGDEPFFIEGCSSLWRPQMAEGTEGSVGSSLQGHRSHS